MSEDHVHVILLAPLGVKLSLEEACNLLSRVFNLAACTFVRRIVEEGGWTLLPEKPSSKELGKAVTMLLGCFSDASRYARLVERYRGFYLVKC